MRRTTGSNVVTGTAGESHLWLRATKYCKPDIEIHSIDVRQILTEKKSKGELTPVVHITTDGGNDFAGSRLAAVYLYGLIYRDFGLEGLILIRRAGGLSAYNDIERLWAYISRKLGNLQVAATIPGESTPPCNQSLDEDELMEKEFEVFDSAMDDVVREMMKDGSPTFNGKPVNFHKVPSLQGHMHMVTRNEGFDDITNINSENVNTDEDKKKLLEELRVIIKHVNYTKYRLVYTKCNDPDCDWVACVAARRPGWRDRAPKWTNILKAFNFVLPTACPDPLYSGHFQTFLGMYKKAQEGATYPPPDWHCPTLHYLDGVTYCTREPSCSWHWSFLNKSARTRHDLDMHFTARKKDINIPTSKRLHRLRCSTCKKNFHGEDALIEHCRESSDCNFDGQSLYRYFTRIPGLDLSTKKKIARADERRKKKDSEVCEPPNIY